MKGDDETFLDTTVEESTLQEKEKKPRRARKAKVEAAEAAEGEHSDFHTGLNGDTDKPAAPEKETKVKRGASKARGAKKNSSGKVAKTAKVAKAKRTMNGGSRMDPEATVTWIGKDNPFRESSGSYLRTEVVRKNSGKTVAAISKLKELQEHNTLRNLKNKGLVKIV